MLILLTAVFCSNIISRLISQLSVPIVQILLGVVIALLPLGLEMEIEPEIFLILFIAPIVFNNSIRADKVVLWKLKAPIASFAFGLVLAGTLIGGFFVHWLIPLIPLAAACAIPAALGPTDVVAVSSFSKNHKIPHGLLHILEGECLFNDASGIVSCQFAIAAVVTGAFHPLSAGVRLLVISAGGVVCGLALTGIKYLIARWIRQLGLENVTLHLLLEILTPFLIYIAAETVNVSGVFAVVTSGIVHSFAKKNLTPHNVNLNTASVSVWAMLSFTLDGLIFLILGTQLPGIVDTMHNDTIPTNWLHVGLYILAITAFLFLMRFLWSLFSVRKKTIEGAGIGRIKSALILCLSGTRGAITLAIVMSIPVYLENGKLFPQRDLIILTSAGVILCTLLMANFLLPVLAGKKGNAAGSGAEANIAMLQNVITELGKQATPENEAAVKRVTLQYYMRITSLKMKQRMTQQEREEEIRIQAKIAGWQKEYVQKMLENGKITEEAAERYLDLTAQFVSHTERRRQLSFSWRRLMLRTLRRQHTFVDIKDEVDEYVLGNLRQIQTQYNEVLREIIFAYEATASFLSAGIDYRGGSGGRPMREVATLGFQMERDSIHKLLEDGIITWEAAREMRATVSHLEAQLDEEG